MTGAPRVVLRGGRVLDPARGLDEVCDLALEGGRVAAVGRGLGPEPPAGSGGGRAVAWLAAGTVVVEAAGMLVVPGLIDLHVHLRTPGQEWKEDIASGTRAAAAGGFTTVCCMPNTEPPLDDGAVVEWVRRRAEREGTARVLPVGCLSRGRQGTALAEIGELAAAGVVALSDDGAAVMDAELMRRALEYARAFGLPVSAHEEDARLAAGGVMHRGAVSAALGLRGQPAEAEAVLVARDLLLAERTGARLHVAHVSAAASVALIRHAKERGVRVTAEATPHHLVLTDEAVRAGGVEGAPGYDTNAKCNPPLRGEADRLALLEGLRDGTIDAVATDHAPHAREDKEVEFERAAFGLVGLETALGLVLTEVVGRGHLTLAAAIERLTAGPARAFGLPGGTLAPGAAADVTVIDPDREWVVDPAAFRSKGRNTPFGGWRLRGKAVLTLLEGRATYADAPYRGLLPEPLRHPLYIDT